MQLNSYLMFDGRCEEAFQFYTQVLGGKIEAIMKHTGTPAEQHAPPEWRDKILHACLNVGGTKLMGSDMPPDSYEEPKGSFVNINVEDPAAAERIFHALEEGGAVRMPIAKTFFAERFGMVVDRFGVAWMVHCAPHNN
jgi:PhnB protein